MTEKTQAAPEPLPSDDYVWWLQEEMPDGRWESIEQADEDERALDLLRHAENHLSGLAYRLWRSDWEPESVSSDGPGA